MSEITFITLVKKHFGFLESKFGYKVIRETVSNVRPQTDGGIEYASDTTIVYIDSETGYVGIRMWRIKDGKKYYLTPIDISEYLNTDTNEKKILLSTNPKDQDSASVIFNKKFLLNQPDWIRSKGTNEELEKELERFSNWLKDHAELCLKGDFSRWPDFYEYKIHRARADHLRRGKDELEYVQVKDADGNLKLEKQSIFKDKLEHAKRLRQEFSKPSAK